MNFIGKHLCRSLFFNKVSLLQAKERLLTGVFLWVVPNILIRFFAKPIWVTTSTKYTFLFSTSTSITKCVFSALVTLNIFEISTVNCLRTALCEFLRQSFGCDEVDLLLIEQVICLKCCYKSEAIAQLSSIKMRFCKTSQISQKTFTVESLFRKPVRPQACNSTKKNTIAGVFLWIYLCKYIFSFSLFFFQKRQMQPSEIFCEKRCS